VSQSDQPSAKVSIMTKEIQGFQFNKSSTCPLQTIYPTVPDFSRSLWVSIIMDSPETCIVYRQRAACVGTSWSRNAGNWWLRMLDMNRSSLSWRMTERCKLFLWSDIAW
jgi:hypothetical protein